MKDEIKISIGIVVLAGVGYYFYNKNKKSVADFSNENSLNQNISTLDKEKLAKDFAGFAFPIIQKAQIGKTTIEPITTTSDGRVLVSKAREISSELSIYKQMLAMLNGISDDSDALFLLNEFKKMLSFGDSKKYKADLDTQIRLEKIQIKYPKALNSLKIFN
jgi:hypothetical protein